MEAAPSAGDESELCTPLLEERTGQWMEVELLFSLDKKTNVKRRGANTSATPTPTSSTASSRSRSGATERVVRL